MDRLQDLYTMDDFEVVVIGEGPVGLLLANLLVRAGIRTALVEKRTELPPYSMAIGITPPSLEILSSIGLAEKMVAYGVPVREVPVYDGPECLGKLSFADIASPWPFVLSIPQNMTMTFLRDALVAQGQPTVLEGYRFERFTSHQTGVTATLSCVKTGAVRELASRFLVGCDGAHSQVCKCLQMPRSEKGYAHAFLMGEFVDRSGLDGQPRLFFTSSGPLESFPLPGNRRRWIAMLPRTHPPHTQEHQVAWLIQRVQALSGFAPARRDCTWISAFQPQRELCSAYHRGRVILCGDAAHVMSPIGGQGMNVGFADAHFLANTLHGILREGRPFGAALRQYGRVRRRDFRVAAARAAAGMWVGTRRGITARARSVLFRHLLKRDSIQHFLADSFSMLNLPGRTGNSKWSDTKDCAVRLASAFESKENRREVNRRIFSIVAPRYALITRLLSFGRDSAWKRRLIGELPDLRQPACADLACGNGDLTTRLLQKYPDATVTGIDQSPEMLATARTGICSERVSFREADLLDTGLADASCDVVTAGYALRNAPDLVTAIAEVARLLKPGGRFALLDFSRSPHPVVARTQYLLLWLWGGWWGLVLHGNPSLYGYIAASLMRFPDRKRLRYLLEAHGLRPIRVRRGFGGMVETVQCEKMGDGSP